MTKKNWIDLIIDFVDENDQVNKYHPKIVEKHISTVFSELAYNSYSTKKFTTDWYSKEYTGVSVQTDATTTKVYATLPSPILQFPRKASGVVGIFRPQSFKAMDFMPISIREAQLESSLDINSSKVFYVVREDRIEFMTVDAAILANGVTLYLVIPFEEYEDDDIVKIPMGAEETLKLKVLELLQGKVDPNLKNQNNG